MGVTASRRRPRERTKVAPGAAPGAPVENLSPRVTPDRETIRLRLRQGLELGSLNDQPTALARDDLARLHLFEELRDART
jgi:hypothetical protein